MSSNRLQFTLRSLAIAMTFVSIMCASLVSAPPFPKFPPSFPATVFVVSAFAASLPALMLSFLRHPMADFRFWLSSLLAITLGAWGGVGGGYYCNESYRHMIQWPNIGGPFMV